jgi:CHASE2 domain
VETAFTVAWNTQISQSHGLIASASSFFVQSSDAVVREWSLLRIACQPATGSAPARAVILPSVQMLIAAWRTDGFSDQNAPWGSAGFTQPCPAPDNLHLIAETQKALSEQTLRWLEKNVDIHNLAQAEVTARDIVNVEDEQDEPTLGNYIVYRLFDRLENRSAPSPGTEPGFARIPGSSLLAVPTSSPTPWSRLLSGAIVVIGQSNSSAMDTYITPLRRMNGSLIVLNSVDSILHHGFLRAAPELWLRIPVAVVFVVVCALLLALWPSIVTTILAGIGVMFASMVISFIFFVKGGVWFDFTAPLAGTVIGIGWEIFHAKSDHEATE